MRAFVRYKWKSRRGFPLLGCFSTSGPTWSSCRLVFRASGQAGLRPRGGPLGRFAAEQRPRAAQRAQSPETKNPHTTVALCTRSPARRTARHAPGGLAGHGLWLGAAPRVGERRGVGAPAERGAAAARRRRAGLASRAGAPGPDAGVARGAARARGRAAGGGTPAGRGAAGGAARRAGEAGCAARAQRAALPGPPPPGRLRPLHARARRRRRGRVHAERGSRCGPRVQQPRCGRARWGPQPAVSCGR